MAKALQESARTGENQSEIMGLVQALENVLTQACEELETELSLIQKTV